MLTVGLITARKEPKFEWLIASLERQLKADEKIELLIVDLWSQPFDDWTASDADSRKAAVFECASNTKLNGKIRIIPPMPSVWQGPHRVTKENWFANSAARNTLLVCAKKGWLLHLDDRCVLMPGFMDAVRANMNVPKVAFGRYEKRANIKVANGLVSDWGTHVGTDGRYEFVRDHRNYASPTPCGSEWGFGCCGLFPLALGLAVNGWPIECDGLSMEDVLFTAAMAKHPGVEFQYDHRMFMVEDRTPGQCGPVMKRSDKGVSPNDKSHFLLNKLSKVSRFDHPHNLAEMRKEVQAGKPVPFVRWPEVDSYDGMKIEDFV